jgi:hypothetical protein
MKNSTRTRVDAIPKGSPKIDHRRPIWKQIVASHVPHPRDGGQFLIEFEPNDPDQDYDEQMDVMLHLDIQHFDPDGRQRGPRSAARRLAAGAAAGGSVGSGLPRNAGDQTRREAARGNSSMIMKFVARLSSVLALSASVVLALQPTQADAQGLPAPAPRALTYEQQQGKINAWTVGLAAGLIEGAPLRLAAEMARVVDETTCMCCLSSRAARPRT